jgi:preprotein translocase subunit SecE
VAQPLKKRLGNFFADMRADWNKVSRPTREETIRTSMFVLLIMAVLSVFLALCDSVFRAILFWLLTH